MAEYLVQGESLSPIADGIRELIGSSDNMYLSDMSTNLQTAVDTVDTQTSLIAQIEAALEGKTAAASSTIATATTKPSSNSTSIAFTGVSGEPKLFAICPTGNITLGSTRYVTSVIYDGTTTHGIYGYRSGSSATSYYSASYFTWTYSNGTLTIKTSSSTNGGNFSSSATYMLVYVT